MSNKPTHITELLVDAAFAYAPLAKGMTKEQLLLQGRLRLAFVSGGEWVKRSIRPDFKFLLEALPNEHRIADLQLRSEIDLVRNKLNEIISKIQ